MKVLLITGPCGAGKSTISKLLAKKLEFIYLDGDRADTEFFPDGYQWLPENLQLLKKAHQKILNNTKKLVLEGKKVIVDYIIFDKYMDFISSFKREFGNDFCIIVLLPAKEEVTKRDTKRKCWTAGPKKIEKYYSEFKLIKSKVGAKNYLDTTGQKIEGTVEDIISRIIKHKTKTP